MKKYTLIILLIFCSKALINAQWCGDPVSPPCPPPGMGTGRSSCEDRGRNCTLTQLEFSGSWCAPIYELHDTGQTGPGPCLPGGPPESYAIYPILVFVEYKQRFINWKCIYGDANADNGQCCENKSVGTYTEVRVDIEGTPTTECF